MIRVLRHHLADLLGDVSLRFAALRLSLKTSTSAAVFRNSSVAVRVGQSDSQRRPGSPRCNGAHLAGQAQLEVVGCPSGPCRCWPSRRPEGWKPSLPQQATCGSSARCPSENPHRSTKGAGSEDSLCLDFSTRTLVNMQLRSVSQSISTKHCFRPTSQDVVRDHGRFVLQRVVLLVSHLSRGPG